MPAKKTTASKPAAKKTTAKKATAKKATSFTLRDVAIANLGFYGKVFDVVTERVEELRKDAPKQFNAYVKRGEKVQKELLKARKDVEKNVREFDLREELESIDIREQFDDLSDRVRDAFSPSKA